LEAVVPRSIRADTVEWWINGKKIGRFSRPFTCLWNLKPGTHTIQARIQNESLKTETASVRIKVLS